MSVSIQPSATEVSALRTTLNTDLPISSSNEDKFHRTAFAKQIAGFCTAKTSISTVIGLYGRWGGGKSSLINLVKLYVPEETVQIHFNPWYMKDDESLLIAFFKLLAAGLGQKLSTPKERIRKLIGDYGDALGFLELVPYGNIFVKLWQGFLKLIKGKKDLSVEAAKKRVTDFIIDSRVSIVIYIDDIDRLNSEEAATIFRLVKLLADFPRTTYILAFDPRIIAHMLAPKYGGKVPESGYHFIEKMVQIPLSIPKAHESDLIKFLKVTVFEISRRFNIQFENEEDTMLELIADGLLDLLPTPRQIIRYANAINAAIPMLYENIHIPDLLILEAFKVSNLNYYNFIKNNRSIFLSDYQEKENPFLDNSKAIRLTDELLDKMEEKTQTALRSLTIRLFPDFVWVDPQERTYKSAELRDRQRLVCSYLYFDRYFSYSLLEQEMPESHFNRYYLNANNVNSDELIQQIITDLKVYDSPGVGYKLSRHRNNIKSENALALVDAISAVSNSLHQGDNFDFFVLTTTSLIESFPKTESYELTKKVVEQASSLKFAADVLARLVMPESKENPSVVFNGQTGISLKKSYIERLRSRVLDKGFFNALEEEYYARQLLWWYDADAAQIKNMLVAILFKESDAALKLLKIFTPTLHVSSNAESGSRKIKSDFTLKEFKMMNQMVDVNSIYDRLLSEFGDLSESAHVKSAGFRDALDDSTLVGVFQKIWKENQHILSQ